MNRIKNFFLRLRDHGRRRSVSRCFGKALRSHWPLLCVLAVAISFNLYWHHTHRRIPVFPAHESNLTGLEQIIEFKQAPVTYLANLYSHAGNRLFFSLYNLSAALPTAIIGNGIQANGADLFALLHPGNTIRLRRRPANGRPSWGAAGRDSRRSYP